MTPIRAAACALLLALAAGAFAARADDRLRIINAWSRPTPTGALTAAGYMTIENLEDRPDRLLGADSTAANKVELHRDSMDGGIMRMRPVPGGAVVPAQGRLELAPGGYHLMLIGPKRPFRSGDRIPVRLRFAHAGVVGVEVLVENPGAVSTMGGMSAKPGMH